MHDPGAKAIRRGRARSQRALAALFAALADARAQDDAPAVARFERAIAELAVHGGESRPSYSHPGLDALSPRELEVVRCVARGLTDKQIADRLVISPRTVQSHVAKALRKTGTSRRTELAALAIHGGIIGRRSGRP